MSTKYIAILLFLIFTLCNCSPDEAVKDKTVKMEEVPEDKVIADDAEKYDLTSKREIGDSFTIKLVSSAINGNDFNMTNTFEVDFEVEDVENSVYKMKVDFLRLTSNSSINGDSTSYDSNQEVSKMSAKEMETHKIFKDLLVETYYINVDHKGKLVKSFYLADGTEIHKSILDMSLLQLQFPENQVAQGEKWSFNTPNPVTKKINQSTFEVTEVKENEIIVQGETIIGGAMDNTVAQISYVLDKDCNLISGKQTIQLVTGAVSVTDFSVE